MSYRLSLKEALVPPVWTWGGALIGTVFMLAIGFGWFAVAAFVLWCALLIIAGLLNHFGAL